MIQRRLQPSERHAHAAAAGRGSRSSAFMTHIQADGESCFHTSADLAAVDASLLECCEEFAVRNNRSYQIDALTFQKTRKGCAEVAHILQSAPSLSPGKHSFNGLPLLTELGKESFQNEPLQISNV